MSLVLFAADQGATNADWLEAWATVVAAIGTVGAFTWQALALRNERETRRAEIERLENEQRQSQTIEASKVVLHEEKIVKGSSKDDGSGGSYPAFSGRLENLGELPIRDVIARLRFLDDVTGATLPSKEARRFGVFAGGSSAELLWDLNRETIVLFNWPKGKSWSEALPQFYVDVSFADVHGTRWNLRHGRNLSRAQITTEEPNEAKTRLTLRDLGRRVRAAAKALRGS